MSFTWKMMGWASLDDTANLVVNFGKSLRKITFTRFFVINFIQGFKNLYINETKL